MNEARQRELKAPGMEWGLRAGRGRLHAPVPRRCQTWWVRARACQKARARGREPGDELAHLPVRNSLWEQGPLEACNVLLLGCLDGDVEALMNRSAIRALFHMNFDPQATVGVVGGQVP